MICRILSYLGGCGFSFLFIFSIWSCRSELKTDIDIQGHRGCRGLMPENTVPAMIKALELGVNTLEMDVVVSKDSMVVVSHEPFFNHEISTLPNGDSITKATEKSHNIYNLDMEAIRTYDVGMKHHPRFPLQTKMKVSKPLLSEVISASELWTASHDKEVRYNIEIKYQDAGNGTYHPDATTFVNLLMEVLQRYKIAERTTIQCFNHEVLKVLHATYPYQQTVMLVEDELSPALHIEKLGFVPTVYSPYYKLIDADCVAFCNSQGMLLIPWTVNEAEEVLPLLELGVDGIITDYPDMLIEILSSYQ